MTVLSENVETLDSDLPTASERTTARLGDFVKLIVVHTGTVSRIDKDGAVTLSRLDSSVADIKVEIIKPFVPIKEGEIIADGNNHFWTAFKDSSIAKGKMLFRPLNVSGNVVAQPRTIDEMVFPVKTMTLH